MNFESVLIVTYGRSGSTLLQGLLNSIDGCLVRGENHNFCHGLFLAYQAISKTRQQFGKGKGSLKVTSPWFGASAVDERRFLKDARSLVRHQLIGAHDEAGLLCVGFKEIRYLSKSLGGANLHDYLNFLHELFPKPALVILTRDHGEVVKSGWWVKRDPKQVTDALRTFEKNISAYATGKNFAFAIDYRDMTNRTPRLRQLFEFLGVPYIEERVGRVLATPHSFKPRSEVVTGLRVCSIAQPMPEELAYFSVDQRVGRPGHDATFSIGGVAVLNRTAKESYSLVVCDSNGEHPVSWGLPSPAVAKKYHGSPGAGTSRFKIEGLRLGKGDNATLLLVRADGERNCLATLALHEHKDINS